MMNGQAGAGGSSRGRRNFAICAPQRVQATASRNYKIAVLWHKTATLASLETNQRRSALVVLPSLRTFPCTRLAVNNRGGCSLGAQMTRVVFLLLFGIATVDIVTGASKNRLRSSNATKLPAIDSALFPFRFLDVHANAARARACAQLFEVPLRKRCDSGGITQFPNRGIG